MNPIMLTTGEIRFDTFFRKSVGNSLEQLVFVAVGGDHVEVGLGVIGRGSRSIKLRELLSPWHVSKRLGCPLIGKRLFNHSGAFLLPPFRWCLLALAVSI